MDTENSNEAYEGEITGKSFQLDNSNATFTPRKVIDGAMVTVNEFCRAAWWAERYIARVKTLLHPTGEHVCGGFVGHGGSHWCATCGATRRQETINREVE